MSIETDYALERLVEAKGIKLIKKGSKLVGRCPFSEHDADALVIDPKANTWACTEGCGDGGVVDWVARTEGISPSHAEALLRADFEPTGTVEQVKTSTTTKLPDLIRPDEPDAVVLRKVLGFYHRALVGSPEALEWLRDRGLRDPEVITHFHLGLAERTLGYRLPKKNRKAGKLVRGQLRRLGILRKSGHEHFRGSLVVPLFDTDGDVVNVYGRKLNDNLRKGTPSHVWLHDEPEGVLNPEGFVQGQKLILTGSVLDALTWWSWGFRFVSTTMGRDTLPEGVSGLLAARNIRSVALALPRDDTATETIATELKEMGIEVHQVVLPKGMDANAVARQADDPRDALHKLLRAANWVSSGTKPPTPPDPLTEQDGEVVFAIDDRRWRVRGLDDITSHNTMRVNLMVGTGDQAAYHLDLVELYSARQRASFIKAAAIELNADERVLKKDMGNLLLHLERKVDARLRDTLEEDRERVVVPLSDADREAALRFLRDPNLLGRVADDLATLGVVGEERNKKIAYLAVISRKLPKPLAVIIQSSPAAGKSALLDAVLKLVPEEDVLAFSAITGRSLYYLPADGVRHKVLALAEEEGAGKTSYALKLLQSEGSLSIASTAKDSRSGRLSTQTYAVAGPVALLMTTTSLSVDEELLSRCIVLSADEGRKQTRAIHAAQRHRRTLDGLVASKRVEQVVKLHHDAQRLLRPLHVVLPADLGVGFCDHAVRNRRDHGKLLGLIEAVAFLRQFQKDVKEHHDGGVRVSYIEADADDITLAAKLAHTALGRTLDELPPGTRRLLGALHDYVTERAETEGMDPCDLRFTRRELREALAWGNTQIKVHLRRLVDFEYVVVHRSGHGQRVAYELVYNGEGMDGQPFVPGLGCESTTGSGRGQGGDQPGRGRHEAGGKSAGGRGGLSGQEPASEQARSGAGS